MLRRAENVYVVHKPGFFSRKGFVTIVIGNKATQIGRKRSAAEFAHHKAAQAFSPVHWTTIGDRNYYEFQGKFYWDNDGLTVQQVHALLSARLQAQQRKLDRAESMLAMGADRPPQARGHISDEVKQFVWVRDQGRCRNCGATSELQYDHVIPVAMGGSSEAENLQILCGPCNRRKAAGLTVRSTPYSPAYDQSISAGPQPPGGHLPPAGWYPDSSGVGQRYWDGKHWTSHTRE